MWPSVPAPSRIRRSKPVFAVRTLHSMTYLRMRTLAVRLDLAPFNQQVGPPAAHRVLAPDPPSAVHHPLQVGTQYQLRPRPGVPVALTTQDLASSRK